MRLRTLLSRTASYFRTGARFGGLAISFRAAPGSISSSAGNCGNRNPIRPDISRRFILSPTRCGRHLTAIQGSSELMGRYNLNDAKRKQMAEMINSESKRLARMIQTFLDIERLTDGQMEIRKEVFDTGSRPCLDRARPLAERKQIELRVENIEPFHLPGIGN